MTPHPITPHPERHPFGDNSGANGIRWEMAGIWLLRAVAVLLILFGFYELRVFFAYWLERIQPPSFDWSREPMPNYLAVRHSFLTGYPLITAGVVAIVASLGSVRRGRGGPPR